jgi:hypothetical protein
MPNKIIFLDIDGVLNPVYYENALQKMWFHSGGVIKSRDEHGQLFFSQNCDSLKKIIDSTKAKIVVSSAWRLKGEIAIKELWQGRNLSGEIIGITPTEQDVVDSGKSEFYDMVCRGMEIDYWIQKNNFDGAYVIIDDTDDILDSQRDFFVQTNSNYGLTTIDADKAIKILNR